MTRVASAVLVSVLTALAGCATARPEPPRVLDAAAFAKIRRIAVVGAPTEFLDARGELVSRVAALLRDEGCWPALEGADAQEAIERNAPGLGVLVVSVDDWRGTRYRSAGDSDIPGEPDARQGEYERAVSARLLAGAEGPEIWRARRALPSGTRLDGSGRLPVASDDERQRQSDHEYEELAAFLVDNLRRPPNLPGGCRSPR